MIYERFSRLFGRKYRLPHLGPFEEKVSSQFGEDGVISEIFNRIPPRSRTFVEFGIGPTWKDTTYQGGLEGNCVALRDAGWRGLFMDAREHPSLRPGLAGFATFWN